MAQPMGQPMGCAMGGTQGIGPSTARPMVLGGTKNWRVWNTTGSGVERPVTLPMECSKVYGAAHLSVMRQTTRHPIGHLISFPTGHPTAWFCCEAFHGTFQRTSCETSRGSTHGMRHGARFPMACPMTRITMRHPMRWSV